ncbi:TauD/TfdA family dioxygenase [Psychrobacter sp. FDAARGOS_221]|uniref:TauD/TfdA family dioxygenase n=1 Tax=Psychrobacter sp. FDAARGOS_221 TaxID=1975705 RepID=UPI000BB59931|nr:TauD/TfdA family dioxygenase [Psychrobacter sp. FDAARGOS_221]PNK61443.1 TauD/TfdA family dioxygenase [Psychrobacter sp. FDAARGOS_221]
MDTMLTTPITDKCAWQGKDIADKDDWIIRLDAHLMAVLDSALKTIEAKNLHAPDFEKSDVPIEDDAFLKMVNAVSEELENGYGFIVIKGLDVSVYNEQQLTDIFYILGLYLGVPVIQNKERQLLGFVENVGDVNDKQTRVYQTNENLPFHADLSDVVGLLCVRQAKTGGESSLVSFSAVYNTILKEYPEYLAYYYHPAYLNHLGKDGPGLTPMFSYWDGKLACRYLRKYIETGHEIMGVPMSRVQIDALDIFDEISHRPEYRLDMMLEPGDIQLCNNYVVMHSRQSFEDYPEKEKRRKLVRLWLKVPNARTLAPDFPGKNGYTL